MNINLDALVDPSQDIGVPGGAELLDFAETAIGSDREAPGARRRGRGHRPPSRARGGGHRGEFLQKRPHRQWLRRGSDGSQGDRGHPRPFGAGRLPFGRQHLQALPRGADISPGRGSLKTVVPAPRVGSEATACDPFATGFDSAGRRARIEASQLGPAEAFEFAGPGESLPRNQRRDRRSRHASHAFGWRRDLAGTADGGPAATEEPLGDDAEKGFRKVVHAAVSARFMRSPRPKHRETPRTVACRVDVRGDGSRGFGLAQPVSEIAALLRSNASQVPPRTASGSR